MKQFTKNSISMGVLAACVAFGAAAVSSAAFAHDHDSASLLQWSWSYDSSGPRLQWSWEQDRRNGGRWQRPRPSQVEPAPDSADSAPVVEEEPVPAPDSADSTPVAEESAPAPDRADSTPVAEESAPAPDSADSAPVMEEPAPALDAADGAEMGEVTTPRGLFSLTTAGAPIPREILNHPAVSGVIVRGMWPDVEPVEGRYDWSYFDEQIERVVAAGKQVSLVITSGGMATPQWVFDAGAEVFSYLNGNSFQSSAGETVDIPVFWDPVFLEKKLNFIRAMGERYAGVEQLVSIHAHCANAATDDWRVPTTSADIETWQRLGYTAERLLNACKAVLDATVEAFPNQSVRTAIGRTSARLDPDADYVARELIQYANSVYPGRVVAQRHNLQAATPDPFAGDKLGGWQLLFDSQPNVAAQMLWPASDVTSCRMNGQVKPCDARAMLRESIAIGSHYGMQYIEVYGADVRNPELSDILSWGATLLGDGSR